MRKIFGVLTVALALAAVAPVIARAEPAAPARIDEHLTSELASAPGTPAMVFVHGVTRHAALDAVEEVGLPLLGEFRSVGVPITAVTAGQLAALARQPGITYLEGNRPIERHLDTARQATRAAEAMATPGLDFDGTGQTIAVIDSGVDGTHPMFTLPDGTSKVVRNLKVLCPNHVPGITIDALMRSLELPLRDSDLNACPSRVSGDYADDEPLMLDVTDHGNDTDTMSLGGHGTHVAGITAGVEVTTEETTPRTFSGVATGAKIVSISQGWSLTIYAENTALDWVARHHADPCGTADPVACPPITVVNNSYGSAGDWDPDSVTTKIQRQLVAEGVTVVWANGNSGGDGSDNLSSNDGSVQVPGIVSVANYDDAGTGTRDGSLEESSSRGAADDYQSWPDVSAPGTDILSACRPQLTICATGATSDPDYATATGTSMAAPHVSGVVAILQEAALASTGALLEPAEVEDILEDTAYKFEFGAEYQPDPNNPDSTSSFDKGHGLVDVVNALNRVLGLPPTTPGGGEEPGPTLCAPGLPLVSDPEGDATTVASADGGEQAYDAALDVLSVDVAGSAGVLQIVFTLADLTADHPSGTTGLSLEGNLLIAGESYTVDAYRDIEGERFVVDGSEVTGTFDADADTVTVVVPTTALDPAPQGAVVVQGLTDGFSRRTYRPSPLGPVADSFAGSCAKAVDLGTPASEATVTADAPYTWTGETTTVVPTLLDGEPTGVAPTSVTPEGTRVDSRVIEFVTGGGTITVALSCPDDALGADDFDLTLVAPDGTETTSAEGGCDDTVTITAAPSGVYNVRVTAFLAVHGTYTATASVTPA